MRPIDKALWQSLSPLLDRALELDTTGRAALLASLREQTPELAESLEGLLADHERMQQSPFLESSPIGRAPTATLAGRRIGSYTLEHPLGAGGMGSVWLARRSDGRFEGLAAVKFVNLALLDRVGRDRFRREGTILARLSHPHIARLLDAGVTEAGQPYLVLEFVDGVRIDRYTSERRLDVAGRLALFLQIADAVAHAHANLVVHRDLKPSNILVDGAGQVKLLDFGIATLLADESGAGPRTVTSAGRALTPEFAAPEQASAGPITTATDVYALGALLYQLLVGRHPTAEPGATDVGVLRALIETDARRASQIAAELAGGGPDCERILTERRTTADRLRRACRGDLDTILATALKKEPIARYQTVGAFADDIRRHMRREPVLARPDSAWYRWRRFVMRRRLELGAAAAVALALIAGTGVALWQAARSARERDDAVEQLRRAEAANDFSSFLLSRARPGLTPFSNEELLARGEELIDKRYAADPVLRTHMLLTLADRYQENQQFESWRRVLQRAHDEADRLEDRALKARATCAWAAQFIERDEAQRALAAIDTVLPSVLTSAEDADVAAACLRLDALAAVRVGDTARAVASAERAVAIEEGRGASPNRLYLAEMALGRARAAAGRFGAASETYRRASSLLEQQGLADSLDFAVFLNNWSALLQGAGQHLEAVDVSERSVRVARVADTENGASLTMLTTWASALSATGDFATAREALDEALVKSRAAGSAPRLFNTLAQAVIAATESDDVARAASLLEEAQRSLTAESSSLSHAIVDLLSGRVALAEEDAPRAANWTARALASLAAANPSSPSLLPTRTFLARCLNDAGRFAEALAHAEQSLATSRERLGDLQHSSAVGTALLEAAVARRGLGQADTASATVTEALAHLLPTVGSASQTTKRAERLQSSLGGATR